MFMTHIIFEHNMGSIETMSIKEMYDFVMNVQMHVYVNKG
jgi:hypothetical protein